jgi:hypothetical protein
VVLVSLGTLHLQIQVLCGPVVGAVRPCGVRLQRQCLRCLNMPDCNLHAVRALICTVVAVKQLGAQGCGTPGNLPTSWDDESREIPGSHILSTMKHRTHAKDCHQVCAVTWLYTWQL